MIAVAIAVIAGVVAVTYGIVADSNHADSLTFLGVMVKTTAAQIFLAGAICTWALFAALWLLSLGVRRSRERGIELRELHAAQAGHAAHLGHPAHLGHAAQVDHTAHLGHAGQIGHTAHLGHAAQVDHAADADQAVQSIGTPAHAIGTPGQSIATPGQSTGTPDQAIGTPDQAVSKASHVIGTAGPGRSGRGTIGPGIAGLESDGPFSDFDALSTGFAADTATAASTHTDADEATAELTLAPDSLTPPKEPPPYPPTHSTLSLLPSLTHPTAQPPEAERTIRG